MNSKTTMQLKIRFTDCILEDDMADQLPNSRIGCFVQYDGDLQDALMIQEGAHAIKPDSLTLDLADSRIPGNADPRLVFIVKDIQNEEPYVGSVSIPRSIILEGQSEKTYKMWITLFDDQGDDEYDGAMGVNDEEQPRILVEMTITEAQPFRPSEPSPAETSQQLGREPSPQRRLSNNKRQPTVPENKSYMKGIGNTRRGQDARTAEAQPPAPAQTHARASSNGKKKAAPVSNRRQVGSKVVAPPTQQMNNSRSQLNRSNISKPKVGTLREAVQLDDIQKILDANPSRRQNVDFLKQLLDSQLNKLCTNLKVMQGDNSEIETECIQRLQLIDKFGNDADVGLRGAQEVNKRLLSDQQEQKSQHAEVMQEQNQQKLELESRLEDLNKECESLRKQLVEKRATHLKTVVNA